MNDEDRALLINLVDQYGIADVIEELADECERRAGRVREGSMQRLAEKWKSWEISLKQMLGERDGRKDSEETEEF